MRTAIYLGFTVAALGIATSAMAQDAFLGKPEYDQRCAVCHGAEGAGDGAVGALFAQAPRDLRTLAAQNGGVFPFADVYQAIEGRREIAAHGGSEMPIWGDYLLAEALERRNVSPYDAQLVVEARIIALTQYISSLQTP
ncbi:MAG: cytochrome c [Paracoccaceae bacterium]